MKKVRFKRTRSWVSGLPIVSIGFVLINDLDKTVLTDSDGPLLFTDYNRFKEWVKGKNINLLDYRCRMVTCSRFTRHYSVI